MTSKSFSLVVFMLFLALAGRVNCYSQQPPEQRPDFSELLQKIVIYGPDPCGPDSNEASWNSGGIEKSLFLEAADAVVQALNASATTSPRERAVAALKVLEKMSARTNAAWPDENRFHFEIFEFSPVLVIKMSIRTQADFLVFGRTQHDGKPDRQWRRLGSYFDSTDDVVPQKSVDIYPLHRGPSGNVRFLADFGYSGCAGSLGVGYEAFEWDGKYESTTEILGQKGSFGLESPKNFPQIGKLRTTGALITLPYCWFSAIDWWDNPSLCAVDTYDLSGDEVRFRSRIYNRPDLVPIAKAIEYASTHDFQAVRGYCGSDNIAHRLVREAPGVSGASDPKVARVGIGKERVVFDDGSHFDVEKRPGGWVMTAFGTD